MTTGSTVRWVCGFHPNAVDCRTKFVIGREFKIKDVRVPTSWLSASWSSEKTEDGTRISIVATTSGKSYPAEAVEVQVEVIR